MKRKFIINPGAGNILNSYLFNFLKRRMLKRYNTFDYVMTKNAEDIVDQAREAARSGVEQIVVVGGDGTLNGVINGLFENGVPVNPEILIAVAKWGTGGDFYRTVSAHSSFDSWESILDNHYVRSVDVGRAVHLDSEDSRIFINLASVGISAEIVRHKNASSRITPSKLRYILPTLRSVMKYKPKPASVTIGNKTKEVQLLSLMAAKGRFAGGGMKLGANSIVDDGLFDVTLIEKMPLLNVLRKVPELYTGNIESEGEITKTKAESVEIKSDYKLPVELDGDEFGSTDIRFDIIRRAVRICFGN